MGLLAKRLIFMLISVIINSTLDFRFYNVSKTQLHNKVFGKEELLKSKTSP